MHRAVRHTACLSPILAAVSLMAACSGGGESTPLEQVVGLTANPEDRAVLLDWTAQSGGVAYRVSYAFTPGFDPLTSDYLDVTAPPFLQESLENDVTVYYQVAATSGGGVGPFSSEVSATPGFEMDPLFGEQWHLENTGQLGGTPGEDANVPGAWASGFRGGDVVIAIIDDGLEIGHEDLIANVVPDASFDYVDDDLDPTRGEHGTSCGGIAAARGGNGIGVSGSAPRAGLVCFDFLSDSTVANQADAMVRGLDLVGVSSNSWGPPDGTGDLGYPPEPWRNAIRQGVTQGRGGLGIVYVFAAGNGHQGPPGGLFGLFDDANLNGFATDPGVIVIGAVDRDGLRAVYSERGANITVCAPSARSGLPPSPANPKITTTDRTGAEGYNDGTGIGETKDPNYTAGFDGTSAATPIAAGIAALVLQANPALSYRDVRELLSTSARRNDPDHTDWIQNAAGHWVNHDYGFGVVDAEAAVSDALTWTPAGPQLEHATAPLDLELDVPDADPDGVTILLPVNESGISHIEHIELVFSADHPFPSDLEVVLFSPNAIAGGTSWSRLAAAHDTTEDRPLGYDQWRFGSVRHLGESADGTWSVRVADLASLDIGQVTRVQLVIRGR